MNAQQRLIQLEKSYYTSGKFDVMRNENNWLNDYRGHTYTEKLKASLTRGLFEEHAKKADIGYANIEKAMVFNIDPKTMEINELGGSSLLREKKSEKIFESVLQSLSFKRRKIIPDLILDNFGLWYAKLFLAPITGGTSGNVVLTDDTGATFNFLSGRADEGGSGTWNNPAVAGQEYGSRIQMGSGLTAVARADHAIQTALLAAPESGPLNTNTGSYTASNTIIYQADANPTGGAGTVNEIGSFGRWYETSTSLSKNVMIAHDLVSPGVAYTAGKLLRGAYTWQI